MKTKYLPYLFCLLFFVAYAALGIIRHIHYGSGYDLAVIDQAIWKYSQFKLPISTNHAYPFTLILTDHIELTFLLIAPFYWLWNSAITLIVLQALAIASSGIALFLFAQKKGLRKSLQYAITFGYFTFYGMQFALWSDVHSLLFGVAFLAWFIYFLEIENKRLSIVFFILTILCKEDMALLTGAVSFIYLLQTKKKYHLWYLFISVGYLLFVFGVYFPHLIPGGYRFQSKGGLLSHINFANLYNTKDKRDVWLYSFSSVGFLPLLQPLLLLPALADLLKYFVVANESVTSGQGLFGHYRSSLALLLYWPTVVAISKHKRLNVLPVAAYIVICALLVQYALHLPLSYFSKKWFWQASPATYSIEIMLRSIPDSASIVTPINIAPHVSHRDLAFIFWPTNISPKDNPACLQARCDWLHWPDNPHFLLVDLSPEWDARYVLTNNETFQKAIKNLEAGKVIKKQKQIGTTVLYSIEKKP